MSWRATARLTLVFLWAGWDLRLGENHLLHVAVVLRMAEQKVSANQR